MEDIERLSKDANLAYYEMVNSNKHEPLTKVSGNYKLFTKEKDISTQTLQDKIRKYDFSNEISGKRHLPPPGLVHSSGRPS